MDEERKLVKELRAMGEADAPGTIIPAVLRRVGLVDAYFTIEAPLGLVFVAYNRLGVSAVMPAASAAAFERAFRARFGRPVSAEREPPAALVRAVERRLAGQRPARLAFDLRGVPDFEQAVLHKALEIPYGEVRPYGWIAREIGQPEASRAVGAALGRNPVPLLIPCHRVIRSDGGLGGYGLGLPAKRAILAAEGVDLTAMAALARTGVRYHGSNTTHIYCYPTCRHARRVGELHRVSFRSAAEAQAAGYRPCQVCRPGA